MTVTFKIVKLFGYFVGNNKSRPDSVWLIAESQQGGAILSPAFQVFHQSWGDLMAHELYDDRVDYDDGRRDFLRTRHEPRTPANLKDDPTWRAIKLIMAEAYHGTGDVVSIEELLPAQPTISEMLDYCAGIVLPYMESRMKENPGDSFYAHEIITLVSAIRHVKQQAPHLLTKEMDEAIRRAAQEGNRDYHSLIVARIEKGRDADRARLIQHSGSKLLSPRVIGGGEWQFQQAGRSVSFKDAASDNSKFRFLAILIAHPGQSFTAQEIAARVDGEFAPGWSPQDKADSRYKREAQKAGLAQELKKVAAIGGRSRVFGDEEDKAHDNIRKSLDRAIIAIDEKDHELGAYFRRHVIKERGTFCFTDTQTEWRVG